MRSPVAVTAIVPLKGLGAAKGRLAGTLDARDRRALVTSMFDHVIRECRAAPAIDHIVVVAGDADAGAAAARHDVEVVPDPGGGLNAAVAAADRLLTSRGVPASLVLAADLPGVTAAEVGVLAHLGRGGPTVLVTATSDGGTGALLRRPPDVIGPEYGEGSAAAHLAAGTRAGVRTGVVHLAGLAHDVDRPGDLRHAGVAEALRAAGPDGP